ncbi:hypothetical protein CHS0354_005060 [Potamilus streckersoni]|uniref:Ubiquitin-conjugating enzyme E2 T n=1 Tax=Potamilus streckersoni TaxID=2493646 RepID=A0AAE0SHL3_9BIVA|nr:hypothetical protein CHS0354_005060 [Potamilus streckersoni]
MQKLARMKRELQLLTQSPPHGISCWAKEDQLDKLEAQILGIEGTPYEGGLFKLEIQIPDRYPFEPPKVRFVTPIYHPNIDTGGRICLDTLKMPPKGAWKPCLNVSTVLTSIQLLMAEPNPEDPLMVDIKDLEDGKENEKTEKVFVINNDGLGSSRLRSDGPVKDITNKKP